MSIDGLSAKLKAELGRNKAKSAVLIGMCLIAAYFWVPLLGKWLGIGSNSEAEVAVAETADSLEVPTQVVPAKEQTVTEELMDWKTAVSRLREEPLMTSINSFSLTRSPFANLSIPDVSQELEDEGEEHEDTEPPIEVVVETKPPTFDELGLLLNGTMVGSRARMATVNGKSYQEGDEITVAPASGTSEDTPGPRAAETTLVMKEIRSQFVIVSYGGGLHKLRLQPITLSQSARIMMNRPLLNRVEN